MQYKKTLASATLATAAMAAYVPSEPWSTLTPSATYKSGLTSYASSFGIAVEPITTAINGTTYGLSSSSATSSISTASKAKRDAVSQIGDGQVQATTATKKSTAAAASQIADGQVQASTKKASATAASQITDGQVQATTKTASSAAQQTDGQVNTTDEDVTSSDPVTAVSCKNNGTLSMSLKDSILTDSKGRIGSIVANRQFQFDGPPPQAGAIYAAGWSLTPEGNLAIGDNDVFFQCLSGNFYNLYDEHIGSQCTPVHLSAIDLVDC